MMQQLTCAHPADRVTTEWAEPGEGPGLVMQWHHCEECGRWWREPQDYAAPRGVRVSELDPAAYRSPTRPRPRKLLVAGVLAAQAGLLIFVIWEGVVRFGPW